MDRCILAIALFLSSSMGLQLASSTKGVAKKDVQALRVSVLPTKQVYKIGEPIELHLSLENVGNSTVFVGQQLRLGDWICSTNVQVTDSKGRVSPELHWSHPFMEDYDPAESILDAVTKSWVPLAPGYSYGSVIRIDGTEYQFLSKPGQYSVQVTYTSQGMDEPLNYNRLAASPEEIKKLPFPSWKGTIKSDPVSISIQSSE
jgi:hypothetical protein